MILDWDHFWTDDHTAEEWLIRPIIPTGRGVSLYAKGGVGKSLLALHISAAIATGREVLGVPAKAPVNVLYLDYEQTPGDLMERLDAMGYGPDDDMTHFRYALIPDLQPLNLATGAAQVIRLAELCAAQLVVIDTFSRAVVGDENKSDATLEFARLVGRELKRRSVALLRIDHSGKDPEKSARGSSAKNDDVDVVWALSVVPGGVQLLAEKRRQSWIPERVVLEQQEEPWLSYRLRAGATAAGEDWPNGTKPAADLIDALGLPLDAAIDTTMAALKEAGRGKRRKVVAAALRYRRDEAIRLHGRPS